MAANILFTSILELDELIVINLIFAPFHIAYAIRFFMSWI